MKPIETNFMGYRFRSRLEARWAVFFEECGMKWEYEPEGFTLPSGARYLPDFRITAHGVHFWVEVKPPETTSDAKFEEFKAQPYITATLVSGDPVKALQGRCICPRCGAFGTDIYVEDIGPPEVGVMCYACDWDTPSGACEVEEGGIFGIKFRPHKGWIMADVADMRFAYRKLGEAARKARAARFEHGEAP